MIGDKYFNSFIEGLFLLSSQISSPRASIILAGAAKNVKKFKFLEKAGSRGLAQRVLIFFIFSVPILVIMVDTYYQKIRKLHQTKYKLSVEQIRIFALDNF